ncbi:MAG: NAD(+) synthase [Desulfitobacteriaceae bacterium]|nr:NAD(+) synthase [Desulfitobacteriaceae bacterium]MDD4346359.1 NAD(+) synthase [Desulfitobacteriaceae bacterium]
MFDNNDLGFVRVGVGIPHLRVADPVYNIDQICTIIDRFSSEYAGVQVALFPELCITGYSCGDLFNQRQLIISAERELAMFITRVNLDMLIVLGMPILNNNQLFNCAVAIHRGHILGVVPKTFIPNYSEFYEKRWFASSASRISKQIRLCNQVVPFNENLIFRDLQSELRIGIEICEDLWMPIPPSSYHAIYGANLILNLSASNNIVGKSDYRRNLVSQQSARTICGYIYASAGSDESTTDVVFGGHSMIAENGMILAEQTMYQDSVTIVKDIDIQKLMNDRSKMNSFMEKRQPDLNYLTVDFNLRKYNDALSLKRKVDPYPFVPNSKKDIDVRCNEIFAIQSTGLIQRLIKTNIKKVVIGISGGLDSTLALLICFESFKKLNLPVRNIIGITMPGFGTTNRTYANALKIMKGLEITVREISIKKSCLQHFKDIDHDLNVQDITYENVQARERTQILMDVANKEGGFVVGTGDLSELALGWCTYNGDHMSMYAVNSSIPKTLVRYLVKWYSTNVRNNEIEIALLDILDTPVSPELLPPDSRDKIIQKTEDMIGPYELHDFFLYNMVRQGFGPRKIFYLTCIAFKGKFLPKEILKWLKVFYKRFFTQQFKRSCMPDGPKVGSVALSPRGDWIMPSDASYSLWLSELEDLY